ncbi:MAG: glycosyltransferase family 4 protein [Sedimentisphaerales bacterium]
MHVLLVCNEMTLGGAERYLIDLANSLVERGVEVTMAFGGAVHHKPGPVEQVRHLEINLCRRFGKLGPFRLIVDLPVGKRFYRYIRDAKVDVVNTIMIDSGIWCWLASRFLSVPIIHKPMHVFSNYSSYERFLISSRLGAKIIEFLGVNFLPGSDYSAWELTNIIGVPPKRVYIARMGVDLHKFRPKAADDRIRKELGLVPGPVIGSIGRLWRVKGCHKIISAMPTILQICPEAQLLLVGDGPERQALERQAKELRVRDNVIFAGWRNDTAEITVLLDVYIQTTDGPSLGISVLQALAQAKPLVVFAADELEKKMASGAVQDGVNGHIVPTNEPDKAGETIGKMLTDNRRLKEMASASRKLAEEKFDWQLHVSKVIEIYQKLQDKSEGE